MSSLLSRLFSPLTTRAAAMSTTPSPVTLPPGAESATVAAGCFWGVEHMYRKHFSSRGLLDARVGYIGGDQANPSYRAVCSGETGRNPSPFPLSNPTDTNHPTPSRRRSNPPNLRPH